MNLENETVILAGTYADAQVIAARLGLAQNDWIMPRTLEHLRGRAEAPVYFDLATFDRNPAREVLREWFGWRMSELAKSPRQSPRKLDLPKEARHDRQKSRR